MYRLVLFCTLLLCWTLHSVTGIWRPAVHNTDTKETEEKRQLLRGTSNIIGGHEVEDGSILGSATWMVSIQTTKYSSPMHMCGGVIVDQSWVMTAQHCVQGEKVSDLQVVAGDHALQYEDEGQEDRLVVDKISHEGYDEFSKQNDVALLRLKVKFRWSEKISPIDYVSNPQSYEGVVCEMMGYGPTTHHNAFAGVLTSASMIIFNNTECSNSYQGIVMPGMMCASNQEDGSGPCQGDWGGPLVCREKELAGIASWSVGCSNLMLPVVFVNATYYYDWIFDSMNAYESINITD